jgi:hypothetical protein
MNENRKKKKRRPIWAETRDEREEKPNTFVDPVDDRHALPPSHMSVPFLSIHKIQREKNETKHEQGIEKPGHMRENYQLLNDMAKRPTGKKKEEREEEVTKRDKGKTKKKERKKEKRDTSDYRLLFQHLMHIVLNSLALLRQRDTERLWVQKEAGVKAAKLGGRKVSTSIWLTKLLKKEDAWGAREPKQSCMNGRKEQFTLSTANPCFFDFEFSAYWSTGFGLP